MRVLVCGDREWGNYKRVEEVLDNFHKHLNITCIIEGGAKGADTMARYWATKNQVRVEEYEADWKRYRLAAGPIRNSVMLHKGLPQEVLAFHNKMSRSKGTKNMLTQARKDGVRCVLYTDTREFINEEIPL